MFKWSKKKKDLNFKNEIHEDLIEDYKVENIEGSVKLEPYPSICPCCYKDVTPKEVLSRINPVTKKLDIILTCTIHDCKEIYIAEYEPSNEVLYKNHYDQSHIYKFKTFKPWSVTSHDVFDEYINGISPKFQKIYKQSVCAEHNDLDEIAGMGYRKALENLIKDYCVINENNEAEKANIRQETLGNTIKNRVTDPTLKIYAERIAWIGNDHTHMLKRWDDVGLEDMRDMIKHAVNHIVGKHKADEFKNKMPN